MAEEQKPQLPQCFGNARTADCEGDGANQPRCPQIEQCARAEEFPCFGQETPPEGFTVNTESCKSCLVRAECEAVLLAKAEAQAPEDDQPTEEEAQAQVEIVLEERKPKVNNRFDMELRVVLTDDEKRDMAEKALRGVGELRNMREDKKAVVKEWDSRISDLEGRVQKLSEKYEKGYELRPVPCEEIFYYTTGMAIVYRTDTGEVVKERRLSASEMQAKLPIEDPKKATEKAPLPKGDLPDQGPVDLKDGMGGSFGGKPHPEEDAGKVKIEES